jgi:hypothetical protein
MGRAKSSEVKLTAAHGTTRTIINGPAELAVVRYVYVNNRSHLLSLLSTFVSQSRPKHTNFGAAVLFNGCVQAVTCDGVWVGGKRRRRSKDPHESITTAG